MSEATPEHRSYFAAAAAFASGTDSPRQFLERCIAEITARDGDVKAFFATNFAAARLAADAATERWAAGAQISPIDGMPVGVKDIMETADMPTEQGSALFKDWHGGRDCAAVAALRDAGAIILGKTVTTEFAASAPNKTHNPWDLSRTPGGSSSGSAAAVGCGMLPGATASQVIGSTIRPASYCGAYGYKPSVGGINRGGSFDGFSQSCTGMIAASLPECWVMTREITARVGGDAGYVGVTGPMTMPAAKKPGKVAMLYTAGWDAASDSAKAEWQRARQTLVNAGIVVVDRDSDAAVAAVEAAIAGAMDLAMSINAWEGRWPLNSYRRDRDPSLLSDSAKNTLRQAEAMDQDVFAALLGQRDQVRRIYADLKSEVEMCVTLAAPRAAPTGLEWTGDPSFTVATSLIGMPSVSLPVLQDDGLPLGLQMIGFSNQDAALFAYAGGLEPLFHDA